MNSKSILLTLILISNVAQADPLASMIEQASRSVVFVATEANSFDLSYGREPGYYEYLRPVYEYLWPSEYGHGSGFIVSPDGYVVTNAHVVRDTTKVLIILRSQDELRVCEALRVGKDERCDVAILKIEDESFYPLPFLKFGDSKQVQLGQQVVCIGSPVLSNLESTITAGIVSGVDRNNFDDAIEGYIQTDAALNPGNSGGPLFNAQGEVIGVVSFGLPRYEGLAFGIPSFVAESVAQQLIAHGKVSQGFLGVELEDSSETAFVYDFDRKEGAFIVSVIANSPAAKAGLQEGDLILQINDRPIASAKSLRNQIAILEPKTSLCVTFDRDGEIMELTLELGSEAMASEYSNLHGPIIL